MLREAGKPDMPRLERYLRAHGSRIPRTTVRYAIERFPPASGATCWRNTSEWALKHLHGRVEGQDAPREVRLESNVLQIRAGDVKLDVPFKT